MAVLPERLARKYERIWQDVRYALRTLRRAPAFSLTAIAVIALGIGANTAAFSVADFVLLRPLAFPDSDALVRLCQGPRQGGGWGCNNQLSPANYRDFKARTTSFAAMGAFRRDAANLATGGTPQRLAMAVVTSDVLPVLGVPPAIGRWFREDVDDLELRTVVISHALWQSGFDGTDVLGRAITLDGVRTKSSASCRPGSTFRRVTSSCGPRSR